MMNTTETFTRLHQQANPLILPNAWDAASARIFEDQGALAIATTSAGVAWSLGYPDGYKMPAKLSAQVAQNIARVINVPLSVDFENGYSDDPSVVAEHVKLLLDAGVAGINIEDGKSAGTGVTSIVWQTAARIAKTFLSAGDSAVFNETSMPGEKLQQLFPTGK